MVTVAAVSTYITGVPWPQSRPDWTYSSTAATYWMRRKHRVRSPWTLSAIPTRMFLLVCSWWLSWQLSWNKGLVVRWLAPVGEQQALMRLDCIKIGFYNGKLFCLFAIQSWVKLRDFHLCVIFLAWINMSLKINTLFSMVQQNGMNIGHIRLLGSEIYIHRK